MRFAVLIIGAAIFLGGLGGYLASPPAPTLASLDADAPDFPDLKIIYFGVRQCGPCRHWKEDVYPEWRDTPAADHIRVVKLETATFRDFHRTNFGSYEWLREELQEAGKLRGTPTFVLLLDDEIRYVGNGRGLGGWDRALQIAERKIPREYRS